jgi:hypothetical protein
MEVGDPAFILNLSLSVFLCGNACPTRSYIVSKYGAVFVEHAADVDVLFPSAKRSNRCFERGRSARELNAA